jgi:DNA-binding MurR/RpiR family transcriptional regulator
MINYKEVDMSNIGFEVLKIALKDAVEKQQLITEELKELPEESKVRKLVAEQSHTLEETLTLLNRIT